jgi:predicted negative regulator of RcsB-dependent stress response
MSYKTEEEQIESIKKWWNHYSNSILILLSLVLLTIAGYRYWHSYQANKTDEASRAYEHLMVAFSNQNNKAIKSYANQLIKQYPHTVYADAAHLTLAKLYVNKNKLKDAAIELQSVAASSKMPALKQVAKIRLARVLVMNKAYDKAVETLEVVTDKGYLSLINELKGDIYASKGEYQRAIHFYRLALEEAKKQGLGNLFLEMKTNEMAALTTAGQGQSTGTELA